MDANRAGGEGGQVAMAQFRVGKARAANHAHEMRAARHARAKVPMPKCRMGVVMMRLGLMVGRRARMRVNMQMAITSCS